MLNKTFAAVYRRLRKMAGLTQRQAAHRLKVGRSKIQRIEAGLARIDPEKEARLIELARCWGEHLVEIFCEEFSRLIKKLVSIGNGHGTNRLEYQLRRQLRIRRPPRKRPYTADASEPGN